MPRIRKKTSKRITTRQREKFKKKVSDGRKKKRKEAKKNPQWKSRKPKDPGIPNNFPYKDQILAEVAEQRRLAEEAKEKRKEEKRLAKEGLLPQGEGEDVEMADGYPLNGSSSKAQLDDEVPVLLNPELPNLGAVLEKADVVLQVLDARDPNAFLLPHVEEIVKENKKGSLVYVLNKIDLVPREALQAWLKRLRAQRPTFPFRSASAFLPKLPFADPKAKGKAKESAEDSIGSKALLEYLGQQAQEKDEEQLQVAVVGLVNSGKSAIVNSLASKPVVPVYALTSSTDAWSTTTTRAHEVEIKASSKKINVIDTPGVSFENEKEHDQNLKIRDMLLRSRGRVDKVKDPVPPVERIVTRASTQDLMLQYNLPAFPKGDVTAFLNGVSRAANMLKKGGEPDHLFAGRAVLKDWTTAKLPYYTDAPPVAEDAKVVDEDALKALYTKADEAALKEVKTKKERRKEGGLVLLERSEVETRKIVLDSPFVVEGESDEEDEYEGYAYYNDDEDEEDDEEDDEEEEGGDDDDDDDGDDDEDESSEEEAPKASLKRKAGAAASRSAPPKKKVVFAAGIQDAVEKKQERIAKSKAKSKPAVKPGSKSKAPAKASNKPSAAKETKDDDAYDFNQFF